MVEAARAIKQALEPSSVPLLINDRVDVALAAEADGVHVGQDDMAVEDARLLLGRNAIIGLTIKTVAEAQRRAARADRLCRLGRRLWHGLEKQKNAPIGPEACARHRALHARAPKLPICGIAGINAGNAAAVIEAGADGVAVISALSLAPDPAAAARALRAIVDAALAKRGA